MQRIKEIFGFKQNIEFKRTNNSTAEPDFESLCEEHVASNKTDSYHVSNAVPGVQGWERTTAHEYINDLNTNEDGYNLTESVNSGCIQCKLVAVTGCYGAAAYLSYTLYSAVRTNQCKTNMILPISIPIAVLVGLGTARLFDIRVPGFNTYEDVTRKHD